MNPIQRMAQQIERELSTARVELDAPANPTGEWFLDINHEGHTVVVQWRDGDGFGISSSLMTPGLGEAADELEPDFEQATERVLHLLRTRSYSTPSPKVALRMLREFSGVTQASLAERLGVTQAAVSRMEGREDITLASLQKFVRALGGTLEIDVRTSGGEVIHLGPRSNSTEPTRTPRRSGAK